MRPEPLPHEAYLWDAGYSSGSGSNPSPRSNGWASPRSSLPTRATSRRPTCATRPASRAHRGGARRKAEARRYAAYSERVREAWTAEFRTRRVSVRPATQATCVRALAFGLVPEETRATVAAQLAALVPSR